jgi:hypothetical protein
LERKFLQVFNIYLLSAFINAFIAKRHTNKPTNYKQIFCSTWSYANPSLNPTHAPPLTTIAPEPYSASTEKSSNTDDQDKVDEGGIQEEDITVIVPCQGQFDMWTLLGGVFIGLGLTAMIQLCVRFYASRQKSSYSEPFKFEDFVNS